MSFVDFRYFQYHPFRPPGTYTKTIFGHPIPPLSFLQKPFQLHKSTSNTSNWSADISFLTLPKTSKRRAFIEKLPFFSSTFEKSRKKSLPENLDLKPEPSKIPPSRKSPLLNDRVLSNVKNGPFTQNSEPPKFLDVPVRFRKTEQRATTINLPRKSSTYRPNTLYDDIPLRLNRTLTTINFLPPVFEHYPLDPGNLADEESTTGNEMSTKRTSKRYTGSHTTSTYDAQDESPPDSTSRRRLIGFLHRTSHLSLTSELSADASFYLIGKIFS